jgi:hypothetical protein
LTIFHLARLGGRLFKRALRLLQTSAIFILPHLNPSKPVPKLLHLADKETGQIPHKLAMVSALFIKSELMEDLYEG